jgi:transcriptional regulator with XRE-family HTH domain
MAYNSEKVSRLVRSKGLKAKDFFAFVYPERTGNASFHDIESNTNPKADTIERIANLLQCPIDDLFDRETKYATNQVTGDNNTVSSYNVTADPEVLAATNKHLRDVIERQDKTIAELNHRIDQLIELAKR